MALGASTASGIGGAVSDIFAGMAAKDQAKLRAKGIRIGAEGTRIGAEGTRIGAEGTRIGAEGTRLSAASLRIKAQGDIAEAESYDLAAGLARKNEEFTRTSTAIKSTQLDRDLFKSLGGTRADIAGAGFAESGSAIDIMRESAAQGALSRAVLAQQGLITEAGYEEQAKSFEVMSAAGRAAAAAEMDIAGRTDILADRTDTIAARQDLIAGRQDEIARQEDQLAIDTEKAGKKAATGSFISAAIKGFGALFGSGILGSPGGGGDDVLPGGAPLGQGGIGSA